MTGLNVGHVWCSWYPGVFFRRVRRGSRSSFDQNSFRGPKLLNVKGLAGQQNVYLQNFEAIPSIPLGTEECRSILCQEANRDLYTDFIV